MRNLKPNAERPDRVTGVPELRLEWIVDEHRFAAVEAAWDLLAAKEPSPFARHAWFAHWWRAFAVDASLRVCVLWEGDTLVGAAPLVGESRRLTAMVNDHTPLYAPFARDERVLAALAEAVMGTGSGEVELGALPSDGEVLRRLRRASDEAGRSAVEEPQHVSPFVDMSGSFEQFKAESKPRWGAPLERFRRKMGREHGATFSLAESPVDLDRELERGLRVESSGWKGRAGTSILSQPSTACFYRSVSRAYHGFGELKLSGISLDGQLVAFDMSLLHNNRLWLLKTGFDESYRRLAPGLVLRLSIIERGFELGLAGHELLGDDSEWKRKFANGHRAHCRLWAYRARPAPMFRYAYRRWTRPRLRRMYHRVRSR